MRKTLTGKKILSLLLSVLMCFSLIPTVVFTTAVEGETPITTDEELIAAIQNAQDGDTIYLGEGDFTTYGMATPNKSLTFVGSSKEATVWTIGDLSENYGGEKNGDYSFDGCEKITFKSMTLKSDNKDYRGFIRIKHSIVEDCILIGQTAYWGTDKAEFRNSTFNALKTNDDNPQYVIWDYSSMDMVFDNCVFNVDGKTVNAYNEKADAEGVYRKIELKDCTVNSTAASKAVLNLKNNNLAFEVTLTGKNEVTGLTANESTGSVFYQVENTASAAKPITVYEKDEGGNLKLVYSLNVVAKVGDKAYASLAEAVAAADNGATVKLLTDITGTESVTIPSGKDIILDLAGKSVTINKTAMFGNIIAVAAGAKLTINDTVGNGKLTVTGQYSNVIENSGTLIINNGAFEAVYGPVKALGGSNTTINDGIFSSSDSHYGLYYWAGSNNTALTVTVNGGVFKDDVSTATDNGKVSLTVNGGSFKNDLTAFCDNAHMTKLDADTNMYVYSEKTAPAGYAEDENGNATISTADGMVWFAKLVNDGKKTYSGKTVTLANDIDLTGKEWTPINGFKGTFDGNGKKISNFKYSTSFTGGHGYGFFDTIIGNTVKNVTFENASVSAGNCNIVGIVTGYAYGGTFENVHVTGSEVIGYGKVGGIVGMSAEPTAKVTFKACSVTDTKITATYNSAGICGLSLGAADLSGSYVSGNEFTYQKDSSFGNSVVFDDNSLTVTCDGTAASCPGNGTVVKGRYVIYGEYYTAQYSDFYNSYGSNEHACTLSDGYKLANSELTHDAVAAIGDKKYSSLQDAFDSAVKGDTVALLSDITLTEQVNILTALDGLTVEGNNYTINCQTTDDPTASGGSALYFGNANDKKYCTGITIRNLNMTGKARFGIFLCGGTTSVLENVNISGEYLYAINFYGTHGATMTNCNISNSFSVDDNENGAAVWTNVASANPLILNNTKISVISINTYTTANTLAPKIFVNEGSETEVRTLDNGAVSKNKKLCVSTTSTGKYTVKEKVGEEWVEVKYVAEIGDAKYETLQAAINAATGYKKTVKLLADTKENVTIDSNVGAKFTLDLNGFTLNGGTEKGKAALTVNTSRTIYVTDSSAAKTGTIKREDTAENSGVTSYYVIDVQGNATLIFEGGNVINNSGIADGARKGASLVRIGDDSVNAYPQLTIKGGTFTQDNFVAIKVDRGTFWLNDGTINCANDEAVKNWGTANIAGGTVNGNICSWVYKSGSTNGSTLNIKGGVVNGNVYAVSYDGTEGKNAKVLISGGEITGKLGTYQGKDIKNLTELNDTSKATIGVSGGIFSEDPAAYVTDGFYVESNGGKYAVYKNVVAKIGNTEYITFDEAFSAVKDGETIVLLRDYTTDKIQYSGSKKYTIDLNNHTWTCTGTDNNSAAFEINYPNASLTVKNGTVVSGMLIGLIPSTTYNYDNSSLIFENVIMTSNGNGGFDTNGNNENNTITLKDSTLNVPNGYGVFFPSSGSLNIENTKINAKTLGVQVCAGSLNITGDSEITVTGDAVAKTENSGAIEDGAAVSVVNRSGYKGLGTVNISGGKFTAKVKAIKAYDWNNTGKTEDAFTASEKVAVSGGTFSSAVSEDLCAEGFIPTTNADGTFGVKSGSYVAEINGTKYASLAEAIAAAKDGETVKLIADTKENVTVDKKLTLDLNGFTLNGGTEKGKPALKVNAEVTVKDSSAGQTGTIMREDTAANSGVTSHYVIDIQGAGAKLTFEGGNVVNNSGTEDNSKGASLIRVGDDTYQNDPVLHIKGGKFTQNNFVVIKVDRGSLVIDGGELYSGNSYVIENWWYATINDGEIYGTIGTWSYSGDNRVPTHTDIYGGTINGDVRAVRFDANAPAVKVSIKAKSSNKPCTAVINGELGTYDYDGGNYTPVTGDVNVALEVSGGRFSSAVLPEYCAEGFEPVANGDGTFGVTEKTVITETRNLTVVINNGADYIDYTVDGVNGQWYDSQLNTPFALGAEVTLKTFERSGYKFLYWTNGENRILSTDNTYSFTLVDNMTVKACYYRETTSGSSYYVVFRDKGDKIIKSATATNGKIKVPTNGNYAGWSFDGWYDASANGNRYTVDADGYITVKGDCTVYAHYVLNKTENLTVTVDGTELDKKYSFRDMVTVTADKEKDGKKFAGWYVGETLVSCDEAYSFYITGDTALTTKYTDEGIEKQPIVTLFASEVIKPETGNQYIVYTLGWSVPEGMTFEAAGILITADATLKDSLNLENAENDNVIHTTTTLRGYQSGNYIFTQGIGATTAASGVYAVGYVTYKTADGSIVTIYTPVSLVKG